MKIRFDVNDASLRDTSLVQLGTESKQTVALAPLTVAGTASAAYTTLNTNLSSSSFGKALASFDPRIMQLALKLAF